MIRRNFLRSAVACVVAAIAAPTSLLAQSTETEDHLLLKRVFNSQSSPMYIVNYGNRCAIFTLHSQEVPKEMHVACDLERQRLNKRMAVKSLSFI